MALKANANEPPTVTMKLNTDISWVFNTCTANKNTGACTFLNKSFATILQRSPWQLGHTDAKLPWRIKFKLCWIIQSVFHGRCPAYLTATVQSLNASRPHLGQRLRPTSSTDFSLPQLRTKFRERAFSHASTAAWNSLPEHIRAEPDIRVFLGNCWRCIFLT